MSGRSTVAGLLTGLKDSGVRLDLAAGEKLHLIPAVDDQGVLQVGNGTNDMDVKVFLGSTSEYVEFNVGASQLNIVGVATAIPQRPVVNVAANATVGASHYGSLVTNRGATGAVVVTLPDGAPTGAGFDYVGVADQDITFATETADTLITLDDAAADSLAFSTASNKIGARARFDYDGTAWHATDLKGTATVATA